MCVCACAQSQTFDFVAVTCLCHLFAIIFVFQKSLRWLFALVCQATVNYWCGVEATVTTRKVPTYIVPLSSQKHSLPCPATARRWSVWCWFWFWFLTATDLGSFCRSPKASPEVGSADSPSECTLLIQCQKTELAQPLMARSGCYCIPCILQPERCCSAWGRGHESAD